MNEAGCDDIPSDKGGQPVALLYVWWMTVPKEFEDDEVESERLVIPPATGDELPNATRFGLELPRDTKFGLEGAPIGTTLGLDEWP